MSSVRTVKKLETPGYQTFDQQFWPVVVALTVLCGIGSGAIVALLHGPWLWGSLLALPTASAVALYWLSRLDDRRLRRSLQLAILCSLALHLLFLVGASAISVFQSMPRLQPPTAVQPAPRTIEFSDRKARFVWEEPNRHETPEPVVEEARKQTPTTHLNPQTIVVEELTPHPKPEIVKRQKLADSIPRLDESLAELRRQRESHQPVPRVNRQNQLATSPVSEKLAAEAKEAAPAESTESVRENELASAAVKRTDSREPSLERTKTVPSETKPDIQLADAAPRSATAIEIPQAATASSAPSPALRTAQAPRLTPAQPRRNPTESPRETAKSESPPQPSPLAADVTRRATPSEVLAPAAVSATEVQRSLASQQAQSAERKQTELAIPSITSPTSTRSEPRRSAMEAPLPISTATVERPSVPAPSESAEVAVKPRTLSVTRSTSGVAGVGRAENLASATGGAPSPATRPSDSSARAEPENQRSELRQLIASQSPNTRRSTQAALQPSTALKADVSTPSNVQGSEIPAERSLEAAAARIDASRSEARSQVSVERGSAVVDLGPTKVLPDASESPRRSGGGQPEIAQLNPEIATRSRTQGKLQPSLAATPADATLAPSTQSSVTTSSELQPNAQSTTTARSEGQHPTTLERDSATMPGEIANAGTSSRAVEMAPSEPRHASQQTARELSQLENSETPRRGNTRAEVTAAPHLRGDRGLGNSGRANGQSLSPSEMQNEEPGEAVTAVQRSTALDNQSSGIGRTPLSSIAESLSSQSAAAATAPRRAPKPGVSDIGSLAQESPSNQPLRRDSRLAENGTAPKGSTPRLFDAAGKAAGAKESNSGSERERVAAAKVEVGRAQPETSQGFELQIVGLEGKPGLSKEPADSLGMNVRWSDRESLQLQAKTESRIRNSNFGGTPAINPAAIVAKESFRKRNPEALKSASDPSTEAAIQLGLQFLARNQNPDGSWSLGRFDQTHPQRAAQLHSDAAATGLALLAFQGAGYNHREFKYATVVRRGLDWLIENQKENGCLYVETDQKSNASSRMYSHGIAALALTEAYGMTQDARLKEPAQRAMDYIIQTQDDEKGGWRYFEEKRPPGSSGMGAIQVRSTDTSVTGWMMTALHSGRLVGLNVDPHVFEGIEKWLDWAVDPDDASKYRYNPFSADSTGISRIQARQSTPTMTAVGLLMRIYGGLPQDDPNLIKGANWLVLHHLPSDINPERRDTYYWYYATQVLKFVDGPMWEQWDQRLRPLLIQSQVKSGELAGSWHPYNPIPDRFGAFGGRLYVTTMNLLSLEVRHRMLPLYQKTNR
jgi:hypothetical protein